MNAKELIARLQECVQNGYGDLPVRFVYDYGDHVHSQVAHEVKEVDLALTKMSGYHNDHVIVDIDDVPEEREVEPNAVVIN